jgi:hypothetical protein
LDGASVVAIVGELEPAGMPQHVGMHEEREFRSHARPGNHALISSYGQWRATFRDEDEWGLWSFPQEVSAPNDVQKGIFMGGVDVAVHRFFFVPNIRFQFSLYALDTGFWPSPLL